VSDIRGMSGVVEWVLPIAVFDTAEEIENCVEFIPQRLAELVSLENI
jgi:hypothetical protein